jgi:hypothetical protein
MSEQNALNTIARVIIDAFDVDIHIYTIQFLRKLRETSFGIRFATWAENNPTALMNLLRASSVIVQRLPKNDSLVIETITDHLKNLPVDIWTVTGGQSSGLPPNQAHDTEFRRKYEQAVEGLPQEELAKLAKLRQGKLLEWVNSPPQMRTVLLTAWQHEPKLMSKAIIFWGLAFAWLFINLLFVDSGGIYLLEDDTGKDLIEMSRKYGDLWGIPKRLQTLRTYWVAWFSWRFLALYSLVFCPFYSVWVVYKAITR